MNYIKITNITTSSTSITISRTTRTQFILQGPLRRAPFRSTKTRRVCERKNSSAYYETDTLSPGFYAQKRHCEWVCI